MDSGGSSPGGSAAGGSAGTAGTGGTGGGNICQYDDEPYSVTMPLDAYCANFPCSPSLDEALATEQARCNDDNYYGQTLVEGCGLRALGSSGAYGGSWQIFDAETGELVGASNYSDTTYGPCRVTAYHAGVELPSCSEQAYCAMCRTDGLVPVCRLDCDCDGLEPVIDPCHAMDSCQCYCAMLAGTSGR